MNSQKLRVLFYEGGVFGINSIFKVFLPCCSGGLYLCEDSYLLKLMLFEVEVDCTRVKRFEWGTDGGLSWWNVPA